MPVRTRGCSQRAAGTLHTDTLNEAADQVIKGGGHFGLSLLRDKLCKSANA